MTDQMNNIKLVKEVEKHEIDKFFYICMAPIFPSYWLFVVNSIDSSQ